MAVSNKYKELKKKLETLDLQFTRTKLWLADEEIEYDRMSKIEDIPYSEILKIRKMYSQSILSMKVEKHQLEAELEQEIQRMMVENDRDLEPAAFRPNGHVDFGKAFILTYRVCREVLGVVREILGVAREILVKVTRLDKTVIDE